LRQLFIAEKRTRGDVEIHLPRAEVDCANGKSQLACEADHWTELVIDWSRGNCSAILGDFTLGNGLRSSNYSAVAESDRRDKQHRCVLKSLQVENTEMRDRAVDLMLEIEKIREAIYNPGPR
jgi:hypothetical protein